MIATPARICRLTELPGLAAACQAVQPIESTTVQTEEQLRLLVHKLETAPYFALDTETTSLDIPKLALVGISFAFSPTDAWYIPVGHISIERQLDIFHVIEAIKPALERRDKTVYLHHAKYDIAVMQKYGITIPILLTKTFHSIEDSLIAAWIQDEGQRKSLKVLAHKLVGMKMTQYKDLGKGKTYDEEGSNDRSSEEEGDFYETEVLGVIKEDVDFKDISKISVPVAAAYAKDDAIATLSIFPKLWAAIEEEGLTQQYAREMSQIELMVHCSFNGVPVDVAKFREKHEKALVEVALVEDQIKTLMLSNPKVRERVEGRRGKLRKRDQSTAELKAMLSLKSPQLKQAIFYEDFGLADDKTITTKSGGYSTNRWAMNALVRKGKREGATENEKKGAAIAELLARYTKLTKRVDAFFNPLATQLVRDSINEVLYWLIFAHFNNIGARTGRWTSSGPNLQQMPRDTKDDSFREIFIAPKGYKWVCRDMSQIELRVAAHFSEDPNMVAAYRNDEDIHTKTAMLMSRQSPDDFEGGAKGKEWSTIRTKAKASNFGILYGMSDQKLYDTLINDYGIPEDEITVEECKTIIADWYTGYAGVQTWIQRQQLFAEQYKYVTTLFGRKRRLPNCTAPPRLTPQIKRNPEAFEEWRKQNRMYRSAQRIAVNSPVQGTAADLMKMAMYRIFKYGIKTGAYDVGDRKVRFVMQVHDELSYFCAEETAEAFDQFVGETIAQCGVIAGLLIPIKSDGGAGDSWSDSK